MSAFLTNFFKVSKTISPPFIASLSDLINQIPFCLDIVFVNLLIQLIELESDFN